MAHLFSVAAGLDSMVVGEAQILGQVRATLVRGQDSGTAGRVLNGVGQRALRVGKRVHAETGIDRSGVSVVSVALDAAADVLGDLGERRVLVVGAGSMGALAASTLVARGASDVVVANRTAAVAERVAAGIPGGRAIDLVGPPRGPGRGRPRHLLHGCPGQRHRPRGRPGRAGDRPRRPAARRARPGPAA